MNVMSKYTALLIMPALVLASLLPAMAQPPATAPNHNEAFQSIQQKLREKNYAEALAEAERVLQTPELSANDKVRFINAAADALRRQSTPDYAAITATYERLAGDATLPNPARIAAIKNIADTFILTLSGKNLDEMDITPAFAILDRALKLPGLNPEEQATALRNVAALAERADDYSQARQTYQKILELEVQERTKKQAQQLLADTYIAERNETQALALYRQYDLNIIAMYNKLGDSRNATQEITRVLDDAGASDKAKWEAFQMLPFIGGPIIRDNAEVRDTLDALVALGKKHLPALLATDPNRAAVLLVKFRQTPFSSSDMRDTLAIHPEFLTWAAPLLLKISTLSDADYRLIQTKYIEALAAQRQSTLALAAASTLAADARVPATTRLWAQLVTSHNNAAEISKVLREQATLSEKEKAEALLNAARTLARMDNFAAAKLLNARYEALLTVPGRASIVCPFVPNAPSDVNGWLASPLLKNVANQGKMDRPYGDNLQFLIETDAAVLGRQAASNTKEPTGDTQTDFHVACDEFGLHFFIYAHDTKIKEVASGLLNGGSFEMYLAPGPQQAYVTYLPQLPEARLESNVGQFVTMYPNAQFRLPSVADGTLRTLARTQPDGTAMYFAFAWELFYDKLPASGDKWQFESIRWTRSGGFSFGGSESVHNRSSWGDVVFNNLTPQNLSAIKRGIIYKAVAKYKAAKSPIAPVGNWADKDLGDPEFFRTQVEPLLAKLDAHAATVTANMSDATVETLYRDAVPGWMELEHNVAALRAQYLRHRQIGN